MDPALASVAHDAVARTPLSLVAATPTAVAEQEQAVCVRPVHVFESVLRVKLFLSHFVFSLFFSRT